MSITEQMGSRKMSWGTQGGTGTRVFVGSWSSWKVECPRIASTFPGEPTLKLKTVDVEPLTQSASGGYNKVKITCNYSTYTFLEDAPVESGQISGEVLETALGRTWQGTGTKCQQSMGVIFPLLDWNIKLVMREIPKSEILAAEGKVNYCNWRGFPRETLLYQGATWDNRYDYERYCYIYTVTHKFSYRPRGWNVQWRAAEQLRVDGALVYDDQNQPVFVEGPAGVGGWDRMSPPLYEQYDFNPLLGLPPMGFAI